MNTNSTAPTRTTWRQFCKEPELTDEERAAHKAMVREATHEQLSAVMDATETEYKATLIHCTSWSLLVKWRDTEHRLSRAELDAWERIKEAR